MTQVLPSTIATSIAYCVVMVCLSVVFFCCLYWYIKAFRNHQTAHDENPVLYPLTTGLFNTLRAFYTVIIGIQVIIFPMLMILNGFGIETLMASLYSQMLVTWHSATYQTVISIISIHSFMKVRFPENIKFSFTRKILTVMITLFLFLFALRDYILLILLTYSPETIKMARYYWITYIFQYIVLFTGMILEFKNPESGSSFSEKCIATHIKVIGCIKLTLLLILVISLFTGFQILLAVSFFFFFDIFWIPIVIEITEIKTNPTVI